ARDRATAYAGAALARVGQSAGVAVVARAPIGLGGVRTRAGGLAARPDVVTLVERGTDDGVPARAHAAPAGVGLRARVAVAADTPVGLGGVRAGARRRVAGAGLVALVRGRTRRRATAHAGAVLARVGLGASIPVVAGAPLGLGGVRARPGGRVAGPRVVALVRCRADDRVRARARAHLTRVRLRARVAVVAGAAAALGGARAGAGGRGTGPRV